MAIRLHYKAGDKLFVYFAGTTVDIINPVCGEVTQAQIFVATLGCSNLTYVETTLDSDAAKLDWCSCAGVAPSIAVCDNLKAAVSRTKRNQPELNQIYADPARYCKMAILPARVRRLRDKLQTNHLPGMHHLLPVHYRLHTIQVQTGCHVGGVQGYVAVGTCRH